MNYSKLNYNNTEGKRGPYKGLSLSPITIAHRAQIKSLQDQFMTFNWDGFDAFENFGAFIVNDKKGSLKFYNGPGFSNEYTKPQFDNAGGSLMGVTFNKQQISFTIAVYWISIEHYRLLLDWLSPLKISYISFGYSPKYRYNVKLSKLGDSTRYIVGNESGEPMYYTELNLTFELQGTQCAKGMYSYELEEKSTTLSANELTKIWKVKNTIKNSTPLKEYTVSDLPTPVEFDFRFDLKAPSPTTGVTGTISEYYYNISLEAIYKHENKDEVISLFNLGLINLTLNAGLYLNIKYNSETGLIFLKYGNSNERLLNLLNLTDTGEKIVDFFNSNKFYIPGQFDFPSFDITNLSFNLKITQMATNTIKKISSDFFNKCNFICYPRTNIA